MTLVCWLRMNKPGLIFKALIPPHLTPFFISLYLMSKTSSFSSKSSLLFSHFSCRFLSTPVQWPPGSLIPFPTVQSMYQNWLIVAVQLLSCFWLFTTPWTAARQASLFFTTSQSLLKLMPIDSVMPSNHLILSFSVPPFSSRLQSFPASGSFLMNQLFLSGGQSIGASVSASVLPIPAYGQALSLG